MGSKCLQKNIFESGFDSFEFDDGFLMKVDSDLKKHKINASQYDSKKVKSVAEQECIQEKKEKKTMDVKNQFFDLPLFMEDLDESDFFDLSQNKNKKHSSKVSSDHKTDKESKTVVDSVKGCLSPILGPKSMKEKKLASSTPVKPDTNSDSKEKLKVKENNLDYGYLEADLFDDWDINEISKGNESKVTLSQALKLIEEAESARESDKKEPLNLSIDLLTGEVVGGDIGDMFDESFDIPKSDCKKQGGSESSSDSVIIVDEIKSANKPLAAQRLDFKSDTVNPCSTSSDKENHFRKICFDSDGDFDFLTQDLLAKPKVNSQCAKPNSHSTELSNPNTTILLKDCDLNESSEAVIRFKPKRRRHFKIIESDTTEDSPSPKFHKQLKAKMCKRKNLQETFQKEFIISEAEVSDEVDVSSDEAEEDGDYDKSFLDEESYFSQNCSANMMKKYLESVKTVSIPGSFKIPASKPYNPVNVFSQILEESNTDYVIDSFCVNETEEETKTELSELEIAEEILEMDRKEKRRKRFGVRKLK